MTDVLVAFFAFMQVVIVTLGAYYVPRIRKNTKNAVAQNERVIDNQVELLETQKKQVGLLEQMLDSNGKTGHLA